MSGAQQPSTLASFSQDWVGGDIHGLSAFAGTVYGYLPEMSDVVSALEKSVAKISQDAGWSGSAATAFSTAWQHDALAVTALISVFQQIGDAVDALAVNLANIERALEDAADEFGALGVKAGSGGLPPTMPDGPYAVGSPGAKLQTATNGYAAAYNVAMGQALEARNLASQTLQGLYGQIAPPGAPGTSGESNVSESTPVSMGGLLRSLWSSPTTYRDLIQTQVATAEKTEAAAVAAFKTAKKLYLTNFAAQTTADAKNLTALGDKIGTARTELSSVDSTLEKAESVEGKVLGSSVLNTSVNDAAAKLAKVFTAGGSGSAVAAGEASESTLSKIIKIGDDIPVIDVLAVVAGTALDSDQSIRGGKPWYEAVPEDLLANVSGAAAAVGVMAGTAALIAAGAPAAVVVAGVAVAGVTAIGVTDEIENLFSENWSQDIHKSGVVAGTLDGIGHSFSNTGKEAWHTLTSIF